MLLRLQCVHIEDGADVHLIEIAAMPKRQVELCLNVSSDERHFNRAGKSKTFEVAKTAACSL